MISKTAKSKIIILKINCTVIRKVNLKILNLYITVKTHFKYKTKFNIMFPKYAKIFMIGLSNHSQVVFLIAIDKDKIFPVIIKVTEDSCNTK